MRTANKTKRLMPRKLVARTNPHSIAAEQYRTIRTNINFSTPDLHSRVILFTSAAKEEGKSTTAANMAIVFAETGKKVLLIDADMRRPTLYRTFQLGNNTGLSNLLLRKGSLKQSVKVSGIANLDLLMSGQIPPNPAELLEADALDELIAEMRETYDYILFDSPPILSVTDSKILANRCDGTVLVVNTGKSEKISVEKARDSLATAKALILGVVLNNYPMNKENYYYHNYNE
ncbi:MULTISPECIES: CpsD/CapB family tyrosine-protein kinase [Planococcus]|uniref:non-specific protein-tyrosine kinase n=2 Tax=Planococcus TaxID=1372 RepID=A0ABM5WUL5_9BACL|nr:MULTISPECIES: CpsD/CapB family tyrosine-protein kinase [Planococcus]ALS77977.1 capsular biosynthesis protein [Planococcus kocurii]AQU80120.1 capsular biosynthesis protein [Planococcus faecalis]KAA0958632.1 CpsD/CapB family tyrosine-protein kinase [Planococcus sp. ANT_H30]MDJ0330503.1 CpsD/CapB family tyrosine-protein kinase [Planococcus sp. S3-L1]OHX52567.1 capsular biosynthesis protein [Planococcus faecalis]